MKKDIGAKGAWGVVALAAVALAVWVWNTQMSSGARPYNVPSSDPEGVVAAHGRYGERVKMSNAFWLVPPSTLVESGMGVDVITSLPPGGAEALTIAQAKAKNILYPDFSGIVLAKGGSWLFVPEQVLAWHGVLNLADWQESQNISVTYSPFTETLACYQGARLERTGYVWNNNDVLEDGAKRLVLQATGEVVAFPENAGGEQLTTCAFELLTLTQYEKTHPQGMVWMPKDTESIAYNYSPLGGYRESKKNIIFPLTSEWNRALPRKTMVYGVAMDGFVKAYEPTLLARENRGILTEKIGEKTYVVWVGEDGAVRMNEAGAQVFKYASKGGLTDKLGYIWTVEPGTNDLVRGENRLAAVPLMRGFWFFWSVLHPDTQLYAQVAGKGLINGAIDLKETEGETKADDGIKIDVDPSFGKGSLQVKEVK